MAIKGEILLPMMGAALLALAQAACAQYPGQVTKTGKETPELRAIAVLEWTGDPGKPKASRLIPVAVLDAGTLQDGGIYLARPWPLALSSEVEYELQQNGKPMGLFDIRSAGQEQGSWVGFGTWKPLVIARPRPAKVAKIDEDDFQSDTPVLHRKHHPGDPPVSSGGGSDSGSDSGGQAPAADPDRPTLHKKDSSGSSGDANTTTASSSTAGSSADSDPNAPVLHKKDSGDTSTTATTSSTSSDPNAPVLHKKDSSDSTSDSSATATSSSTASDPDRPTLHRRDSGDSSTTADSDGPTLHKKTSDDDSADSGAPSSDPDRPVLKKKKQPTVDVASEDSVADVSDPDRPRLKRGRAGGDNLEMAPTLMGLPADLQQTVAVSDAKSHPAHPWTFSWANPDDEAKMKSALEDIARDALGLNPPPAPPAPAPQKAAATVHKSAKPAPPPPPEPAPLADEQFRTFELAYGSGATLVLTAHTEGSAAQMKFVTLVAQPDLYGNPLVLLKSVTDGAHLDETPRMRLVDAVDAMADNRGELLFELRGATQRQFALYRVLRGRAEKLFVTGGAEFASE